MPEIKFTYNVPITESGIFDNEFIIQGIAINATITSNNHKFLANELRSSAPSLNGVPLLVDHKNEVDAIKGRVIQGEFDEANNRVNFKAKVVDNDIKRMIKEGLINAVSVGAAVKEIEEMEDVLIPRGITFKELSLVAVPADAGATFTMALKEAYELTKPKVEVKPEVISCSPVKQDDNNTMKGGIKMSEEIVTEKSEPKVEVKAVDYSKELAETLAELKALKEEVKSLKEKPKEEKKEAKVEVEEIEEVPKSKYNIVQGFGSLRGSSFTLVR